MAKVKKMAFGGIGGLAKPVMGKPMIKPVIAPKPVMRKPVASRPVAPKPVMGKPVMPGIKTPPPGSIGFRGGAPAKPLPPGSIGMPGGPEGKTVYNTDPGDASNPLAPYSSFTKGVSPPTSVPNSGLVPKNDPFFKSKEFKDFEAKGGPATHDMYNSPYFGSIGSGSVGRAQDAAYRKFKNIPEPPPERPYGISPSPEGIQPRSGRLGLGSLIGSMKKGGAVKTQAKKMASGGVTSSASKRGDGIAQRGRTRA